MPNVLSFRSATALSLLIASLGLTALGPVSADQQADEAYLLNLKQEVWPRAYRKNDAELLDRILHERFILIDANGGITLKHQELAQLPEYRWAHDEFAYEVDHIEFFDGQTAVVSGMGRATGNSNSERYCLQYRSSNVLIKREQIWKAVLSHVSGVNTQCAGSD